MATATSTITHYMVVEQKGVNDYLTKGWELYGNPFCQGSLIYQAMTKVSL